MNQSANWIVSANVDDIECFFTTHKFSNSLNSKFEKNKSHWHTEWECKSKIASKNGENQWPKWVGTIERFKKLLIYKQSLRRKYHTKCGIYRFVCASRVMTARRCCNNIFRNANQWMNRLLPTMYLILLLYACQQRKGTDVFTRVIKQILIAFLHTILLVTFICIVHSLIVNKSKECHVVWMCVVLSKAYGVNGVIFKGHIVINSDLHHWIDGSAD